MSKGVVYFSGGTMRGVFGAGVATSLQESGAYQHISAIRASSAGAITGAYLLAMQTRRGSSMFWEELTTGFISTNDFWGGIYDRLANRHTRKSPKLPVRDAVKLNRLFEAMAGAKHLPVATLRNHTIDLWVKVLDLQSGKIRYFHIDEHDPLELLRASVSLVPYVSDAVDIGGRRYADAAMIEAIGYEDLRRHHPDEKIVVVFNGDLTPKFKNRLKGSIEGYFASIEYGSEYYSLFSAAERRTLRDLELIKNDPQALLVSCPPACKVSTQTRDTVRLKKSYEAGIAAGRQVEEFLSS